MTERLTPLAELADVLDRLPQILADFRRMKRLSLRQAAAQVGMSASTVMRIEAGVGFTVENATAILRWMDGAA